MQQLQQLTNFSSPPGYAPTAFTRHAGVGNVQGLQWNARALPRGLDGEVVCAKNK